MQMEVIATGANAQRVRLSGRLDSRTVDGLEARFAAVVTASDHRTLVDLSAVEFIASMGIRMLVSSARAVAGKRAKFALYGAKGPVKEVFDVASLSRIIPMAADEAGALALLQG